jgi:hypothetical protein
MQNQCIVSKKKISKLIKAIFISEYIIILINYERFIPYYVHVHMYQETL